MVDLLGISLSIVDLSRKVIGYVDAIKDGGKDRETIKFKIEAAGSIIATLTQAANDAPQNSTCLQQLQSLTCRGPDGTPSPISRYEDILCRIKRKLEPKGHKNSTVQSVRKIAFKAKWPFEKDDVEDMVKDLDSLQSSFQSALQAVLGGMMSNLRDSVSDSVSMLENKLNQVLGWQREFHDSKSVDFLGSNVEQLQVWLREFLDWKTKDVLGGKLEQLQVCLTNFLDWTNEDVVQSKLDHLQKGQDKLLDSRDEEDFQDLCSWLSDLSPTSKLHDLLHTSLASRPDWIFGNPAFQEWCTDNSSRVLWAKGNPGAGKSVFAAVVADDLRAEGARSISTVKSGAGATIRFPKTSVSAFFYKYQDSVTAETMLRCIARQLLEQGGADLRLKVKEVRKAANLKNGWFDVATLLRELLSHFDQAFLVIDALDECDVDKQDDTVVSLKSLVEMAPSLYVMVTSRGDMEKYFSGKGYLFQAKQVTVAARIENVRAFVKGKMEQIANRSWTALYDTSPEDREEIVKQVVQHTEGVFLVAVRHMHTLGDCENQHALQKAVSSLSSDLDQTYDEAITRIKSQKESKKKLGRRALLWVVNMRRPLRMEQLQQALATYDSEDDLDESYLSKDINILAATKGLITVDLESKILSVHKSLLDYFSSKDKKVEVFECDPDVELAKISIKYLCFSRFAGGVVGVWETLDMTHELALYKRVYDNTFSLYAAQFWGWHAGGDNEVHLMEDIMRLFNSGGHLRSAIEIWGCVGRPRVNRYRHSHFSDDFASYDLASYFRLEKTFRSLFLDSAREIIDYSSTFVRSSYSWEELLAGLPLRT